MGSIIVNIVFQEKGIPIGGKLFRFCKKGDIREILPLRDTMTQYIVVIENRKDRDWHWNIFVAVCSKGHFQRSGHARKRCEEAV